MSGVFRRCGCRAEDGKQFGVLPDKPTDAQRARACPVMFTDSKHGRWSFRLSAGFDPMTKKRRQVNGQSYDTKREAQSARAKALLNLEQGRVVEPSKERLNEYLPRWLDRRAKTGPRGGKPFSESTMDNYRRYSEKDICPSPLGSMRLRDIRRTHVQTFVDQLVDAGRGAVTVRRIVATLQSAFTTAVKDELIDVSPARLLELPEVDAKEIKPWEPEQVGHFLDVASEHRLGVLFEVAIFTGIRRGELCQLKWEQVDLERQEVTVLRTTTKTDAGRRRVALDDRAIGALMAWQITQGFERDSLGAEYDDTGFVFTMEDGRPVKKDYATRLFQKLREQAGLPHMTFHGQRHQQASLQLAAGVPLAVVSKRLGHSSVSVTADIYSHLLESTEHAAANAAASLVPARKVGARTLHTQGGENEKEAAPATGGNGL